MKKILVLASCAFALIAIKSAAAADLPVKAPVLKAAPVEGRWYIEARLGGPLLKSYDVTVTGLGAGTYKPSSGFGAAFDVGYEFNRNWRAEFEFSWFQGKDGTAFALAHAGKTDVYSFAANGFYTFDFNPTFRPYVGAGIGVANYKVNNLGAVGGAFVINDTQTSFVWGLHAGLDVVLTKTITLTGRYTLAHTGSMTFASVPAGSNTTRNSAYDSVITGGLRFYLN